MTAEIKNPISLARLLLDHSSQSLSLRRVPPNLLIGQGATKFAIEHGMPAASYDELISNFARHRWQKWRADLFKAERHRRREMQDYMELPDQYELENLGDYHEQSEEHEETRRVHEKAMYAAVFNDAQPVSPPPPDMKDHDDSSSQDHSSSWSVPLRNSSRDTTPDKYRPKDYTDPSGDPFITSSQALAHHPFQNSTQQLAPPRTYARIPSQTSVDGGQQNDDSPFSSYDDREGSGDHGLHMHPSASELAVFDDSLHESNLGDDEARDGYLQRRRASNSTVVPARSSNRQAFSSSEEQQATITTTGDGTPFRALPILTRETSQEKREDAITDTVGAIAIDNWGNIAAGASSGGIGMKHRGRVGPAALIGVGATVIPADDADPDGTTVATVTSGTGEHMSTTMASSVCSDRIYRSEKRVNGGGMVQTIEDDAIRSFIDKDFMGHPSVKHSESNRAIGMLTVKKTKDGIMLFFGHNTDSFALASMHSDEKSPVCTMSRSPSGSSIAQGGRSIRFRKKK